VTAIEVKPSPWEGGIVPLGGISGRLSLPVSALPAVPDQVAHHSHAAQAELVVAGLAGGLAALLFQRFLDRVVRGG
jgi:hypothetical protein